MEDTEDKEIRRSQRLAQQENSSDPPNNEEAKQEDDSTLTTVTTGSDPGGNLGLGQPDPTSSAEEDENLKTRLPQPGPAWQ